MGEWAGKTLVVLASFRRSSLSLLDFMGFPSMITGDGSNNFSTPTRALVESLLLVWPPFVDTEHAVSLLSVDEGEVTRFGLDLNRLYRLVSLWVFLCCGTLDGMGLTTAALEGLREVPLRAVFMVVAPKVAASATEGDGNPWFSSKIDPGSSTGGSGVDGIEMDRGRLGRGLCISADRGHRPALRAGERSMSLTTASKLEAEWTIWTAAF